MSCSKIPHIRTFATGISYFLVCSGFLQVTWNFTFLKVGCDKLCTRKVFLTRKQALNKIWWIPLFMQPLSFRSFSWENVTNRAIQTVIEKSQCLKQMETIGKVVNCINYLRGASKVRISLTKTVNKVADKKDSISWLQNQISLMEMVCSIRRFIHLFVYLLLVFFLFRYQSDIILCESRF